MQDMGKSRSVPVSYWIIAVLSLLWNGFGGVDYWMTRTRNMEYLAQMGDPKAMLAWIDAFPLWAQVMWPVGVWASVLGSVLLLMRSRHAVLAFLVSLVGAVVSFASQMIHPMPSSNNALMNMIMPLVIVAVIVVLWWYARRAMMRGWLR